jgi:hypothetical protein
VSEYSGLANDPEYRQMIETLIAIYILAQEMDKPFWYARETFYQWSASKQQRYVRQVKEKYK